MTSPEIVRQIMEEAIPFNRLLGIKATVLRPGFARLELPFQEIFVGDIVRGVLHGGVLSALIDNCGGAAVWTQIDPGDRLATVDLRIDYLRPAPAAGLACEGTVQRLGGRVGVADMRLFAVDSPDVVLATGKGVYNVWRAEPSELG